jgi:uncharacterized surface protein with fasciclin (FAS1) repeats
MDSTLNLQLIKNEVPMKRVCLLLACLWLAGCGGGGEDQSGGTNAPAAGQSAVQDDVSQKDILKVAAGSPDHGTLVKAVQAAGLVDALANAGPFTVFAPVDAAFAALPAGALDDLLKPENKDKLKTILYHHVTTSALGVESFQDGQTLGMVDGSSAAITKAGDVVSIDGHKILASVKASNGMVHVIDAVLLPPTK